MSDDEDSRSTSSNDNDVASVTTGAGTNSGAAGKRKRSTKACDSCHKKKIKCDGATPCQHCTNSKTDCTYTPSTKKRGPRVGYIESLEKRLSMMESLLSSHVQGGSVTAAAAAALLLGSSGGGGQQQHQVAVKQEDDQRSEADPVQMQAALKRARGGGSSAAAGSPAPAAAAPAASKTGRGGGPPKRGRGRPPKAATAAAPSAPANIPVEFVPLNDTTTAAKGRGRASASKPGKVSTSSARDTVPPGTISPGVANPLMFQQQRRRSQPIVYTEQPDYDEEQASEEDDETGGHDDMGGYHPDDHHLHMDQPGIFAPRAAAAPRVVVPEREYRMPEHPALPLHAAAAANGVIRSYPSVPASEAGSVNSLGSDPTTRELPFGENEVVMPLITLFFSHAYPLMPIIHRSSFLERLVPTNQHPPLLLNSIYALAARFSNDPLIVTDPRRPYAAGDFFFNRAKRLLQNALDEPSASTVQSLLLMALSAAGSGKGSLGWLYTGMAIRMAQEMKMNVDYEDLPMVEKPLGWIDRETRRRIWWSCFTMDRCISAGADRPFTIDERDCLLSLPSDETIWEHTHSSFNDDDGSGMFSNSRLPRIPFSNALPYTPPPPGSPPLSHSALNAILCDILGKVLRYCNNARRSKTSNQGMGTGMGLGYPAQPTNPPIIDSELAILDASLRNWYRALPPELMHPHLSGFPYNQHVWMGGYLHITYHAVLVILHRPSFPFPYGPLPIPQSEIGAATHNDPPNGPIASVYSHADEPGHPTILEPQLPSNNPVWPTPISRDVCTTSAEKVGKILEEVIVPNPFLNRFSGFAAYCMFHTGVVHIINAVYPYDTAAGGGPTAVTGDVAARARRFIKSHVLGLRRMTRFWSLAGRYLEALEHLMRANGLDKEFDEAIAGEKQFGGIELAQAFRTADDDEEFGILAGAVGMRPPSPDLPAAPTHRPSISLVNRSHDSPLFDPASPPSGLRGQGSVMDLGFPIDAGAGIGALHPFYSTSGHFASLKTPSNPLSPDLIGSPRLPPR